MKEKTTATNIVDEIKREKYAQQQQRRRQRNQQQEQPTECDWEKANQKNKHAEFQARKKMCTEKKALHLFMALLLLLSSSTIIVLVVICMRAMSYFSLDAGTDFHLIAHSVRAKHP